MNRQIFVCIMVALLFLFACTESKDTQTNQVEKSDKNHQLEQKNDQVDVPKDSDVLGFKKLDVDIDYEVEDVKPQNKTEDLTDNTIPVLPPDVEVPADSLVYKVPEGLILTKNIVPFNHSTHGDFTCKKCHHKMDESSEMTCATAACHDQSIKIKRGEPKPDDFYRDYKNAYHKNCLDCHKQNNAGPVKCLDCHPK